MTLVLVENERTAGGHYDSWQDHTGEFYHFPNVYRTLMQPGERFVYYRGVRQKGGGRRPAPEYFGCGVIDEVWLDITVPPDAPKRTWKWFCSISDFVPFSAPVPWARSGQPLEAIHRNLFGNGVRRISEELYQEILRMAGVEFTPAVESLQSINGNHSHGGNLVKHLRALENAGALRYSSITIQRPDRDLPLVRALKTLYEDRCQICGETLLLPGGRRYSEAHHVRPLGKPHFGPDSSRNLIIVCPNHHVLLDYGGIVLNASEILLHPAHQLGREYVQYHNEVVLR
jgi:hypothetical protein